MQKHQDQSIEMENEGAILIFDMGGGRNGTLKRRAFHILNTQIINRDYWNTKIIVKEK